MRHLLLSITLITCFLGFSQKYKPDEFGHVNDPHFLQLIKTRKYQLVGAFDSLPSAQQTMAAQIMKNDTWMYVDWNGIEYADYHTMGLALGFIVDPPIMEVDPGERIRDSKGIELVPVETAVGKTGAFQEQGKVGYYYHNKVVLKPTYESVTELYQDQFLFLRVQKNGLYGVCDYQGNILIEPIYQQLENTMLPTAACAFKVRLQQKEGVLSRSGKETVPVIYDRVTEEYQAPYSLILVQKNGLSGIYRSDGKAIIPCEYQELSRIWHRTPRLAFHAKRNDKYGILGINGEVSIPFRFSSPIYYQEDTGIILFTTPWGDTFKSGAMDTLGNQLLPAEFYSISQPEGGKCLFVQKALNGPVAIYSLTGEKISEPIYSSFQPFGYTAHKRMVQRLYVLSTLSSKEGKSGLFNVRSLEWVVPCEYDIAEMAGNYLKIGKQVNGLYCYGVVDTTGKMIIPVAYTHLQTIYQEQRAVIEKNKLYGAIDFTGNQVFPCNFEQLIYLRSSWNNQHYSFQKGQCLFVVNDKMGLISEEKGVIIPAIYKKLVPDRSAILALTTDSSMVVNYRGKKLIGPFQGIITTRISGIYGMTDNQGTLTQMDLYENKVMIESRTITVREEPRQVVSTDDPVYDFVEEEPQFPGGVDAMYAFIKKNLRYPTNAKELGIEGKCYVKFIVTANGELSNFNVMRGVKDCKECDQEAVRVLKLMPTWKPGKFNGKAVNSYFIIPVKFSLQ